MSGRRIKLIKRTVRKQAQAQLTTDLHFALRAFFRPRPTWCPRWTWRALLYLPLLLCVRNPAARWYAARLVLPAAPPPPPQGPAVA